MQNIIIGRYDQDPEAQGVIRPENGRWQLVLDKDGYPHLFVEVNVEGDDGQPTKGMFCIEDMLPEKMSVRDLMDGGAFGGTLTPEEEKKAEEAFLKDREERHIPCPR
jgi:hypothetical protein